MAAAVVLGGGASALDHAAAHDLVQGTRSERLVEKAHTVELWLDRGHASLKVRRTVHNGGERYDQAEFWIELPATAVATGLRTLGEKDGKPHWYDGDLLEAEEAAARYRELTGIGGYYPKDPALLSWRSQEQLALQVFPCPPGGDKSVEYTLTLPADYAEGRHHLALPAMGTEAMPALLTLHPVHARDQLFLDGHPVAPGESLLLDGPIELALAPYQPALVSAELATRSTGADRHLAHWEIRAAPRLSEVPKNARLVVLLDGSRSLTDEQAHAATAAARAYLGWFAAPNLQARAQVIVFDRASHARHDDFVPVRRAIADLARRPIAQQNGSALDEALKAAARALAGHAGPRRIVLLTDLRTREELTADRARELARKSGAVLHVGIIDEGAPELIRDDEDEWAQVARATGGVLWQAAATSEESQMGAMASAYEEWARPIRIDHLRLSTPSEGQELPEALDEGEGLADLALVDTAPRTLSLRGELWSRPIVETVVPDRAAGRRWSALLFGQPLMHELGEEEMMVLAMYGGAVSPVTSYLAIEPGVRPSTEGLDWASGFGVGAGRGGGGMGPGTVGMRTIGRVAFDHEAFLRGELGPAWAACDGRDRAVEVAIEATLDEVVDVDSVRLEKGRDDAATGCLADAAWALELDGQFSDERRIFRVSLPG
jgi:hypothetical protein